MRAVAESYVVARLERNRLVAATGFLDFLQDRQIGCLQGDISRGGNAAGSAGTTDRQRAAVGKIETAGVGG